MRTTKYERRHPAGFTIIEVIGVLAVMATLLAVIAPSVINSIDRAAREAEEKNLEAIGTGVDLYIRENFDWPNALTDLSPDFVPFGNTQLTQNARGYPRYFFMHPDVSGFNNATGLTSTQLADTRFLLISNVSADASPTITNAGEFNAWWDTDETPTPDLKIYRGHVGDLFHLVSISTVGPEGSYRIHGTATDSGTGGPLAMRATYHLVGTVVEFDESFNFTPGNFNFGFTLVGDAGYQFNPNCTAGSQWYVLGMGCS